MPGIGLAAGLALLVATAVAGAAPFVVRQADAGLELTWEGPNKLTVTVSTEGLLTNRTGEGWSFHVPAAGGRVAAGEPELPVLVLVLEGGTGQVAVGPVDPEPGAARVVPATVAPAVLETVRSIDDGVVERIRVRSPDPTVYGRTGYWPASPVRIDHAILMGSRILRVALYPVQYDPSAQQVRIQDRMHVTLTLEP